MNIETGVEDSRLLTLHILHSILLFLASLFFPATRITWYQGIWLLQPRSNVLSAQNLRKMVTLSPFQFREFDEGLMIDLESCVHPWTNPWLWRTIRLWLSQSGSHAHPSEWGKSLEVKVYQYHMKWDRHLQRKEQPPFLNGRREKWKQAGEIKKKKNNSFQRRLQRKLHSRNLYSIWRIGITGKWITLFLSSYMVEV